MESNIWTFLIKLSFTWLKSNHYKVGYLSSMLVQLCFKLSYFDAPLCCHKFRCLIRRSTCTSTDQDQSMDLHSCLKVPIT